VPHDQPPPGQLYFKLAITFSANCRAGFAAQVAILVNSRLVKVFCIAASMRLAWSSFLRVNSSPPNAARGVGVNQCLCQQYGRQAVYHLKYGHVFADVWRRLLRPNRPARPRTNPTEYRRTGAVVAIIRLTGLFQLHAILSMILSSLDLRNYSSAMVRAVIETAHRLV